MRDSQRPVRQEIKELQRRYPYPEVINDTADAIETLALTLRCLAPDGGHLLDIGCGAMDKTMTFQQMGYRCVGYDDFQDPWHSKKENLDPLLAFAKEIGVEVHIEDGSNPVPWEPASFDIVTIFNVIEHLHESPRDILNFAGKYLKTGGLLLVGMPNSVNLRKRLSVLRGQSNYTPAQGFYENDGPWRGHVREYTFEETWVLVEWSGFHLVHKQTYHAMLNRRLPNPLLRAVFKGLCIPAPGFRDSILVGALKPEGWVERKPDQSAMQKSLTHSWLEA